MPGMIISLSGTFATESLIGHGAVEAVANFRRRLQARGCNVPQATDHTSNLESHLLSPRGRSPANWPMRPSGPSDTSVWKNFVLSSHLRWKRILPL